LPHNRLTESVALNGGTPTVTNRTYNLADQLTSGSATYDNNGNLTSDGSNTYTWDRANRLLSMGGASYAYDGMGNRIRQTIGVFRTDYLNDLARPLPTVVREIRYDDTVPATPVLLETNRFVHGPRGVHAQRNNASQWYWHTADGLGSVRSVLDHTAAVLWATGYTPNGQGYAANSTDPTLYGFTGEPSDANGLVYLRARHYSPALGQFINRDPAATFNRYAYVDGNPINRVDPSGLRYDDDFLPRPTFKPSTKPPKAPVTKPPKTFPPAVQPPVVKPPKPQPTPPSSPGSSGGGNVGNSDDKPRTAPSKPGGGAGKPIIHSNKPGGKPIQGSGKPGSDKIANIKPPNNRGVPITTPNLINDREKPNRLPPYQTQYDLDCFYNPLLCDPVSVLPTLPEQPSGDNCKSGRNWIAGNCIPNLIPNIFMDEEDPCANPDEEIVGSRIVTVNGHRTLCVMFRYVGLDGQDCGSNEVCEPLDGPIGPIPPDYEPPLPPYGWPGPDIIISPNFI
jgi:RHS repeat-associated protein